MELYSARGYDLDWGGRLHRLGSGGWWWPVFGDLGDEGFRMLVRTEDAAGTVGPCKTWGMWDDWKKKLLRHTLRRKGGLT